MYRNPVLDSVCVDLICTEMRSKLTDVRIVVSASRQCGLSVLSRYSCVRSRGKPVHEFQTKPVTIRFSC